MDQKWRRPPMFLAILMAKIIKWNVISGMVLALPYITAQLGVA